MKPVYKISPSLLNSYFYYLNNPTIENFNSLKNRIKNIFETNIYLERGLKFEDEVFEGKHGKLSELLKNLPKQVWANKTIQKNDYNILISGKLDAIDEKNKIIYDIKRVTKFTKDKYDDSTQHLLYFYIRPDMQEFYYLVATGEDNSIVTNIAFYTRPDNKLLENTVIHIINNFYQFLHKNNLWNDYIEFQKAKTKKISEEKNE
jgi:hypothetical protein